MGIRSVIGAVFLLGGIFLAPSAGNARLCEDIEITLGPQKELQACLTAVHAESDALLNDRYGKLRKQLSSGSQDQAILLRDAQRAWIKYRDAECAWLAPFSVFSPEVIDLACRIETTRRRTANFGFWLNMDSAVAPPSEQCNPPQLDGSSLDCIREQFERADNDLRNIITEYHTRYLRVSAAAESAAMETSQQAWEMFRDRNCALSAAIQGTEASQVNCLLMMTVERIEAFSTIWRRAEYGIWAGLGGHAQLGAYEYPCDNHQQSMNQCANESFAINERRVNGAIIDLHELLDAAGNSNLQQEQAAWENSQERECRAYAQRVEGGSAWPAQYYWCKTKGYKKRAQALESRISDLRNQHHR